MRCNSRKPMSNQLARTSRRSSARPRNTGSPLAIAISSARRAGQYATRRERGLAPGAAQIGQRAVEDDIEKAGGRAIAHGGSAFGEAGNEAHSEPDAAAPAFSARSAAGTPSTRSSAISP